MIPRNHGWARKPPLGVQINRAHSIAHRLIGCWNLNENGGLIARDLCGAYGDGTLTGSSGRPSWEQGIQGTDLAFTGASTQYVSVPNNPNHTLQVGTAGLSIECAFYMNSLRDYNALVCKSSGGTAAPFDMWCGADGTLRVWMSGFGPLTTSLSAGVWYELVYTIQPLSAVLYINGRSVSTNSSPPGTSDSGTAIRFGSRDDGVTALDGKIAYVRMWNRALAAGEVLRLNADPYCFMQANASPATRLGATSPAAPASSAQQQQFIGM